MMTFSYRSTFYLFCTAHKHEINNLLMNHNLRRVNIQTLAKVQTRLSVTARVIVVKSGLLFTLRPLLCVTFVYATKKNL
jgi:hypothetical protein